MHSHPPPVHVVWPNVCQWAVYHMRSRLSSQASGIYTQRSLALPDGFQRTPPSKLSLSLQREALLSGKNNERCKLAWPPCNEADPSLLTNFETPPTGPLHGQNAPQPRIFDLLVFVEYFHRCWSLKPLDKYFSITPLSPNIIVNLMHTFCSGQQSDLVQMQSDRCFKHNQAQISH